MSRYNYELGNHGSLRYVDRVVSGLLIVCSFLACDDSHGINNAESNLSSSLTTSLSAMNSSSNNAMLSSELGLSLSVESSSSKNDMQSSSSITQEYLENLGPSPFIMSDVDCNTMNMISGTPETNYPIANCFVYLGDLNKCTVNAVDTELTIATDVVSYMEVIENNSGESIELKLAYKAYDKTNQIYSSDSIIGNSMVKVYVSPDSVFYSRKANNDEVQMNLKVSGSNTIAYKNGKQIINTYNVNDPDVMVNDTIETLFYHDNVVDKYDVINIGYRKYYLINGELRGVIGSASAMSLYNCKVQ